MVEIELPQIKKIDLRLEPNTYIEGTLINGEKVSIFVNHRSLTLHIEKQDPDDEQRTSLNIYSDRVWLSDRCKQE